MKKSKIVIMILFISAFPAFSQSLDEGEIGSGNDVQFQDFKGSVSGRAATHSDYLNIGKHLGRQIDLSKSTTAKYGLKYSLIHSYQPHLKEKMDADILIIHKYAKIDNIRGIRIIIAGFLTEAYDFPYETAILIAEKITDYNATHYKDLGFFKEKYKVGVISYLSSENVGMSSLYSQWAGRTRIVIPLGTGHDGALFSVDTADLEEKPPVKKFDFSNPDKMGTLMFINKGIGDKWWIEIDGKKIGGHPDLYMLKLGKHKIEVFEKKTGGEEGVLTRYSKTLIIKAGEKYNIEFSTSP